MVQTADGREVLLASVADGAGSASRARWGAWLAVEAFHAAFADAARRQPDLAFLDAARARAWLAGVQAALGRLAAEQGCDLGDYACTFLGAVVGDGIACFLQIGDGAIVLGAADGHDWVFWPQHGEYANSTVFVTVADAADHLLFARRDGPVDELALFSDGLERLILDMTARVVHSPSLRPIFAWLAGTEPAEHGQPSAVIGAFLDSADVNRRTDDDKTLLLATRVGPP